MKWALLKTDTFSVVWVFVRDFLRPYKKECIWAGAMMALSVLLAFPLPILSMYMIDRAVLLKDTSLLKMLGLIFLTVVVFRHLFTAASETAILWLKEEVIYRVQRTLVSHIQQLPLTFFANQHSVYLQSRIMSDARAIEGAMVRSFVSLLIDGMTCLAAIGLVLWIHPKMAFLLIAFVLPFGFLRYYANIKMRSFSTVMQETQARTSAMMNEGFAGIRTVKSYCRQEFQVEIVSGWLRRLRDIYIKTNLFGVLSTVGGGFLTSICMTIVLWYGCWSIIHGKTTIGQVYAVVTLLGYIYAPVNSLVSTNFRIQQSSSAITRIYEFLKLTKEPEGGLSADQLAGLIECRGLSFAYPGSQQPVLQNISLGIPARATVALVGRTGAGKSTLINLLTRFYEPSAGSIYVGDTNIRDLSIAALRNSIGLVDQHPYLFSGTVLENVRFGNPQSSMEEVVQACRMSHAHEFIEDLELGYETLVGERGVRLSGGQRQRIALARVFLKKPKILILDEAVSEIDSESESLIHQALLPLLGQCTTIVVAHRLSSLMLADMVFVLDQGTIVEQGTHRELMRSGGVYADLFREQFSVQPKTSPAFANSSGVTR
jgi:ABC-type multidrug transport system fused ATPase/permease subunit